MLRRPSGARLLLSLVLLCLGVSTGVSFAVPLPAENDFNFVSWELEHLPDKWLYLAGRLIDGRLSRAEEDERLGRYLILTAQIEKLERRDAPAGTDQQIEQLSKERRGLENDVAAILEGRVTAVLEQQGLSSSLPFFPDAHWVFPPVDTELNEPPLVLEISRRDRVKLIEQRPLRPGLSPARMAAEEQRVEQDGTRSALVEAVSGVATYPSNVTPSSSYRELADEVAHEWVHQYLFFKPLGSRYLAGTELQTLNETVATLAGAELAGLVVASFPLPQAAQSQIDALAPPKPSVDVGAVLRQLRVDVDGLLAGGKVQEAEMLMEQRRAELAAQGVYYRRINQAFFAVANIYATGPASTDPIGPKVIALRRQTGSVGAFLRAASGLTSARGLDGLLATAAGGTER